MLVRSKKPFYMISFFTIAALLSIIAYQEYKKISDKNTIVIFTANGLVKISAEYAKTPEELAKGLMRRRSMSKNSGMIFVFPDERYRDFWMKDVLIPLDVIFISSNGQINEIKSLKPCPKEEKQCPAYTSKNPSQYVIEVNSGFTDNKINIGDILEIHDF